MDKTESTMAQQLADVVKTFQLQQTGRAPTNVTVIISEDTLVVTLHEALIACRAGAGQEPRGCRQIA